MVGWMRFRVVGARGVGGRSVLVLGPIVLFAWLAGSLAELCLDDARSEARSVIVWIREEGSSETMLEIRLDDSTPWPEDGSVSLAAILCHQAMKSALMRLYPAIARHAI